MAENVLHTRHSRSEISEIIREIIGSITGRKAATEASNAFLVRIGLTTLSLIRIAFIVKARGGTDDAGESWPPLKRITHASSGRDLSPTIAYSRRHPGLPPPSVRANSAPSYALTASQRTRWWQLYHQGGPAYAWWQLRREDPKTTTLLETYGDTQVEILRSTGLLLNSLSPGIPNPEAATSEPPKVPDQVFERRGGEIIIGTNRKHAASHHFGVPGRIPQRRLWPDPIRWPASWWDAILTEARGGLIDIALVRLQESLS